MILFAYSQKDQVSLWAGEALKKIGNFAAKGNFEGARTYVSSESMLAESVAANINSEFLDDMKTPECIIFLSAHSSARGIESFTVHSEGNWGSEAALGSKGRSLSVAAPLHMLKLARIIGNSERGGSNFVYEATHHGPLLSTPSLFMEFGGGESAKMKKHKAEMLADYAYRILDADDYHEKIVVGIGGQHYSEKFTRLALSKGYAFAHIMPKYYCSEVEMLEQAFERSFPKPSAAVIEWKSIKAETRNSIIKKLNDMGMEYEKA